MKRFFLSGMLAVCTFVGGQAQQDITLDGEWQLQIGDKKERVPVPHTYNTMEGLEDYAGEAIYRRELPVTTDMKDRVVRLCFGAVYHDAIVYVNGTEVGRHMNQGYTPFSFDITKHLKFDAPNFLEVRTSNAYTDKGLPCKRKFDWSNDGGIYRPVKMHISGRHAIRYVHATPQVNLDDSTGRVRFDVRLHEEVANKVAVRLSIRNRGTGEIVWNRQLMLSKRKQERVFSTEADLGKVLLWHFDQPNLYDFTCETLEGQGVSDVLTDHFGFREFKVKGRTFVLNGEEVRLPGIESMAGSNPAYGMAEPREYVEQTVRTMKDLNTTITRFHWQQDEQMLTAMDEQGILAQEELPWWQQPSHKLSPEQKVVAIGMLEEMIEAHYNHPCIYAWGLSNEVWGNQQDLLQLDSVARRLDPTRFTLSMSNHTYRDLDHDASCVLGLPTWNEYTGTWHGKNREELAGRLARLDSALHVRPLFITEAGLCEPAFTGGDATRIDDMLYHIKEWQKWPFVCGYIYFCLQDYRTQMGEEGLGKWRIRRHGVTHTNLSPKASYHVLRQLMSPIEIVEVKPAHAQKNEGSLAGQYEVDDANRDANIVLQVKNTIPSYILRGYQLRYADFSGRQQTINLPDMLPGEKYSFLLPNINARYAFEVMRPNGHSVIKY
ncbi:MAG: hypothetical protein II706_03670 [Bacteroidaceae bacterium]|nr:hypothetical protein [Bacteroidaceae bacterium]